MVGSPTSENHNGPMEQEDLPDETIVGMVNYVEPTWEVTSIDTVPDGVNSTFVVDVSGPDGMRTVALKVATETYRDANARVRAEPRLLRIIQRKTSIPVPTVFGFCDDHETYASPFYVMEYVGGDTFEDRVPPSDIRERLFREAGQNVAELHSLGPLPSVGTFGYQDGEITVLDTEASPQYESFHDWLLDRGETTLDDIESDGGWFPEITEAPNRFVDLVPEIRRYLRETVPKLSDPAPPTYCHKDYRTGNVVIDRETGATKAVLDWGLFMSAAPAFNLMLTEQKLLAPDLNHDSYAETGYAGELRDILWESYAQVREDWTFDNATRERIRVYRLVYRLAAMASLPYWYRNDDRRNIKDVRAAEHRAFVKQYL